MTSIYKTVISWLKDYDTSLEEYGVNYNNIESEPKERDVDHELELMRDLEDSRKVNFDDLEIPF